MSGGRLPYKPMISFIRDRLDFPMATYNTIIMYDFHNKLQKKAPERLKNLERLQILIYSATIPAGAAADRLGASTCIPIRSPFPRMSALGCPFMSRLKNVARWPRPRRPQR